MNRFLRDRSLTLTMLAFFFVFLVGQTMTGYRSHNQDLRANSMPDITAGAYLTSGHFIEATFENWESEYLQMSLYVLLTVFLFQRGSSESKDPDGPDAVDEDPRTAVNQSDAPWPVRKGGIVLKLYENSLTLALLLLFAFSFVMHLYGGAREYSEAQILRGGSGISTLGFARTSQFWFQSFQNWQSEFLAVASIAWLSVYFRQRGSPESKPVAAPHKQTGS